MPQVEQSWLELRGAQEDRLDEKADAAAHRALVESIAIGGALAMFDRNSFVDECRPPCKRRATTARW